MGPEIILEPQIKRAIVFFDGQNLYHSAREAFGFSYPNYSPELLAEIICKENNWDLREIYFYTGIPSFEDNPFWCRFWEKKLAVMGTRSVKIFTRELRYRNKEITLDDGKRISVLVGQEKGIDVRIAIDIIRHALNKNFDVALIFSQDQDLSEVVDEIKKISNQQERWISVASAYPYSPVAKNKRGIRETKWIKIDRETYEACIDPDDYRAKKV